MLTSMKTLSLNYKWQSDSFTNIGKYFILKMCDQLASHFHDNTHLFIIPTKYANSVPWQDCVPLSLNHDTSQLSSDHGDGLTVTTHWGRCCSQTNTSTNSRQHATISCIKAYSLLPMLPCQNPC